LKQKFLDKIGCYIPYTFCVYERKITMNLFRSKEISSFVHHLDDGRKIILDGFWASFKPANDFGFWIDLLP